MNVGENDGGEGGRKSAFALAMWLINARARGKIFRGRDGKIDMYW